MLGDATAFFLLLSIFRNRHEPSMQKRLLQFVVRILGQKFGGIAVFMDCLA
jgi:hypothetical protein